MNLVIYTHEKRCFCLKVRGKLSYKSAIIVNDVFFKEMDELISEYFNKTKYSAQLKNGDEVEFESVSELILYDNFSNRAIKTMRIEFGIGNYIMIEPSIAFINVYKSTIEMRFEVEDNDKSEEIKRKVNLICDKHKQSAMYTAASKFTIMHICILMCGFSFVSNLNLLITHKTDDGTMSNSTIVAVCTVGIVIMLLISAVLSWIIKRFFPAIVFYLGENIKNVEKESKTKSNIFWCIIVAGIVSAIVSSFFN